MLLLSLTLLPRLVFAEPVAPAAIELDATPRFNVTRFQVQGKCLLPTNVLATLFSRYTGTNVSLDEIIHAASALDLEYLHEGYPNMNVIVAPPQIQDGVVTLDAFPGAVPQVVIAGYRYLVSSNGFQAPPRQPAPGPLFARRAPLAPRAGGGATNASPRFTVNDYQITGNTLLSSKAISLILTNIPGAFGTNVSFDKIVEVRSQILAAYRERGYVAVAVELPQQRLTNATVKLDVIEGRLSAIYVKGNRYFSSNNVMRVMPGLHTNMMLNAITFQAELNRANANQDRQLYPEIDPGPDPGTSDLTLTVKDRLPLHEKLELNNENTPGTPELRVNSSAVYDNLWQQEQVLGLQYSFSPELYKEGDQWNFYDLPSVANYSTFYRIPIGSPGAIDDAVAATPGSFGYDEATRKFNLPPASGQPDLTVFASRSTIDDGLTSSTKNLYTDVITNGPGNFTTNSTLNLVNNHQDITINNDVGFRLNFPVPTPSSFHMGFSGGLDFKTYSSASVGTNIYLLSTAIINPSSPPTTNYNRSSDTTPIPATYNEVYYVPLALRYDSSWHDALGDATLGLGMSADFWDSALAQKTVYSSITNITATSTNLRTVSSIGSVHGLQALQAITGSRESTGHWVVLNPTFSHTFQPVTNWVTTFRADGQWASEPLIANEQFGAGGVNSVRGYHEGEVFGDTGWHVSLEQQTPPHTVGMINGRIPLIIRGTVYMDYARVYLLDPLGRQDETALWGTGFGCVASIGSYWQARMLFSFPLLNAGSVTAYQPFFDFALTAQF